MPINTLGIDTSLLRDPLTGQLVGAEPIPMGLEAYGFTEPDVPDEPIIAESVSEQTVKTPAKEEPRQKMWADHIQQDYYKDLDATEQENFRRQYFEYRVSPHVPEHDLFRARMQFDGLSAQDVSGLPERGYLGSVADRIAAITGKGLTDQERANPASSALMRDPLMLEPTKKLAKNISNDVQIGWNNLVQGSDMMLLKSNISGLESLEKARGSSKFMQGAGDIEERIGQQKVDIKNQIFRIHERLIESGKLPQKEVLQRMSEAKTWSSAYDAFMTDPVGAVSSAGVQSMVMMLPALTVGMFNPSMGIAMLGGTSYSIESGLGILDYMNKHGIDVSDYKQLTAAVEDKEIMKEAIEHANTRGAIIGGADLLSGGIASKMGAGGVKSNMINMFIAQPGLGAGGEAGAQLATEGKISSPGEVIIEGVAETATALPEALALTGKVGEKTSKFGSDAYEQWRSRNVLEGELLGPEGPEPAPPGTPPLTDKSYDDHYMQNVPDVAPTLSGPQEGVPQLPAPETPQEKAAAQIRTLWEQDLDEVYKEEGSKGFEVWQKGFMSAVAGEGPNNPAKPYIMGRAAAEKAGLSTYKAPPEKEAEKPAKAVEPVPTAPEIGQKGNISTIKKKVTAETKARLTKPVAPAMPPPEEKPITPDAMNQVMDAPDKAQAKDIRSTAAAIGLNTQGKETVIRQRIKDMEEAYTDYSGLSNDELVNMTVPQLADIQGKIGLKKEGAKPVRVEAITERIAKIKDIRDDWLTLKAEKAEKLSKTKSKNAKAQMQPNELTDDLLTLAAKMGGISRESASGIGVDSANFKEKKGIQNTFTQEGMSVDGFAESLQQMGFDVSDENGVIDATKAEDLILRAVEGEKIKSPRGMDLDLETQEIDYEAIYGEAKPEDVSEETISLDQIVAQYEDEFGTEMYNESFKKVNEDNDSASDEDFDFFLGIELKRQLDEKQIQQSMPEAPAEAVEEEGRRQATKETKIERREGARSRRRDWAMRKNVEEMDTEERGKVIARLRQDARINQLTKIKNWDAWNEDDKGTWVVSMDIDNLGWVNDNIGEAFGDKLLVAAAKVLKAQMGEDVYHKSGDEFWAHGNNKAKLEKQLEEAAIEMERVKIEDAGNTMEGINFSYGITKDRTSADRAMKANKKEREAQGLRVAKTTRPPGITLVSEAEQEEGVDNPQIERELDELEAATFNMDKPEGEITPEAEKQDDLFGKEGGVAGTKPPTGGSTLHSNPLGLMYKEWQNAVDWVGGKVFDAGVWKFTALKRLPQQREFHHLRNRVLGKIASVEAITNKVYKSFIKASPEDTTKVFKYLTDKDYDPGSIANTVTRKRAVAVKKLIWRVGRQLVRRGMLSEQAWLDHENAYLPRVYLRYILGEDNYKGLAGGKKPSEMDWQKMRKNIPDEVREIILGEITDPAFLASRGLGVQMRDIVLIDFLNNISKNENWILPSTMVEWNGHKVTIQWLQHEGDMIRKQAAYYDDTAKYRALALAQQIDAMVAETLEDTGQNPKDFKQIPDVPRYGRLRGMWVRREIYEDILGSGTVIQKDANPAEAILGYGGVLTKGTQYWKISKVTLNPPTQVRNIISNGVLLNLSGVPLYEIPALSVRSVLQIKNNSKYWRIAKKLGVTESTFSNNELTRIQRDLIDYESRQGGRRPNLATMANIVGIIVDGAGDAYQMSEAVFKTMKIMHAMEKEGMSEDDAVIEANKWLYDYSLIPGSVRYLRNAPVGVPFMTFYYKTFPRIVETFVKHPHRYIPYIMIPFILAAMIGDDNDVEKEDVDKLKKAIPKWLQQRGNAYILPFKDEQGRWQVIDIGYFLPWTMFTEAGKELSQGKIGDAWQTAGMLGGPVPDIITGVKTGIDPFTKKPIYDERDPANKQITDIFSYMFRLAAPSWVTDIGFAGRMIDSITGTVNPKTGEQPLTTTQALMRLFGINVYPMDPEATRRKNYAYMKYDISRTKSRLKQQLRDKNLRIHAADTPEQKAEKKAKREKIKVDYMALIKEKLDDMRKYMDESKVHPNLRLGYEDEGNVEGLDNGM